MLIILTWFTIAVAIVTVADWIADKINKRS